ncbi:MAG TPA: sulfite exporter TauE/SafE family protein [Candidatus Saccharimonadales bacterium]|nr:sulfite exporter TauE/SafE family protein [Candidatus Saccharimonadales bacterium]
MEVQIWQILAVFVLTFGASVFSGMAGGGGGFIVLPILIALGLSPQQAVATGKLSAFGIGFGSIAAFKKKSFANPRLLVALIALAFVISLFVPHIFRQLSSDWFQVILGLIILVLIPVVLSKKSGLVQKQTSAFKKAIGGVLMSAVLFMQGVFSGGIGSLNNILLISFFGLSTLQANATRRMVTLSLNTFVIIALAVTTDFIIYQLAVVGILGSFIGGYTGSRVALRRGEMFAKYALAAFMFVSGIILLVTA